MKNTRRIGLALLAAAALPNMAVAAELRQVGTIDVPGEKLANFDISAIDPATGRYYLSDRSNKAIDIFDTTKDAYVGRIGSFVGAVMKDGKVASDVSGPDGVAVVGSEVWAGDGDSTVKVIDPTSGKTVATLPSGGQTRVDEMAYDSKDQAFIAVNNAEDPPFATVTSTKPDHAVIGKVVFPDAGDGAEQPAYNPEDGMFYMSIPQIGKDPKKGAVAVIDPKVGKLVKTLPVDGCHPAGLAFGAGGNFVLGCDADGKEMPAQIVVMNARSGAVVATVPGIGGADMVNYNARNGQYYTASRGNPGGPALGVIDATTNKLVQVIPIRGGTPHSRRPIPHPSWRVRRADAVLASTAHGDRTTPMVRSGPNPIPVAHLPVEAPPALVEQAAATGGPLALAVYATRTALSEAERVIREADGSAGPAAFKCRQAARLMVGPCLPDAGLPL